MKEDEINQIKAVAVNCVQSMFDELGEDIECLLILNKKGAHCTICTNPMEIAKSLMINIADESNISRDVIYRILKTVASSLLLCDQLDLHRDFEDCISDCLMESLAK